MKSRVALLCLLFISICVSARTENQQIDVIFLKDGRTFTGQVIEQSDSGIIKLQAGGGTILFFEELEVERIVGQSAPAREDQKQTRDVVMLRDGVIFRGFITELLPGSSLTIETLNGILLDLPMEEIWKIAYGKTARAEPETVEQEEQKIRELQISLQMEMSGRQLQEEQEKGAGAEATRQGELEQEIESLKAELEELSGEPQSEMEEPRPGESSPQEQISARLQDLIEELMETTKGMWSDELIEGSARTREEVSEITAGLQELVGDLARLSGAATAEGIEANVEEKDWPAVQEEMTVLSQRIRELSRQRHLDDVEAAQQVAASLMRADGWKDPANKELLGELCATLSREQRFALYEEHKKREAKQAAALNLIPFFGLGSWLQGDPIGAVSIMLGTAGGAFCAAIPVIFDPVDVAGAEQIFIYSGLGLLGGSYLGSMVRTFLYEAKENRKLRDILELVPRRREVQGLEQDQATQKGKGYWLFNAGGLLLAGPRLEIGWYIRPTTTLGVHVGSSAFGALYQYAYNEPGFQDLLLETVEGGVRIIRLFPLKYNPNHLYAGCSLEAGFIYYAWDLHSNWLFRIIPHLGYRLQLASRFFVDMGGSFGVEITYSPEPLILGEEFDIWPRGNLEISIGREF